MDAACGFAQLLGCGLELGHRFLEQLAGAVWVALEAIAGEADVERERDQPLLGTIVEVAFELAPLGDAGLDDPLARALELGDARAQLGVQPLVLEHQSRGGSGGLQQTALLGQRAVVDIIIAASGAPSRATGVHARSLPGSGSSTSWPSEST